MLNEFQAVAPNAELENARALHICRTNCINLEAEGCENLWEWCRKRRQSGSRTPKGQAAREFCQCMEFADCWLYGYGSSSTETSLPLEVASGGQRWPVVVGLPYPAPSNKSFPYVCPALAPGRQCWHVHMSRLVVVRPPLPVNSPPTASVSMSSNSAVPSAPSSASSAPPSN